MQSRGGGFRRSAENFCPDDHAGRAIDLGSSFALVPGCLSVCVYVCLQIPGRPHQREEPTGDTLNDLEQEVLGHKSILGVPYYKYSIMGPKTLF